MYLNYKKVLFFFIAVSFLSFGLVGCDGGSDNDDDSSGSVTTSSVTISGTLATSSLSNISTVDDNTDDGDFIVWIQNHATGQSWEDTVDDDTGEFSITAEVTDDLTGGRNFIGVIINRTLATYAGTISLDGSAASNRATGMKINGDVSDLNINFDSENRDNGRADITSLSGVDNIQADTILKMNFRDGDTKPAGFGNAGKGADSRGNSNSANLKDIDEDGIPDAFDAMNDGSTLDNARASGPKTEDFFLGSPIAHVIMFMNLKVDKGADTDPNIVTDNAIIVIEAQESALGGVSAAAATILHSSWKTGVTLDRYPGGITPAITPSSTQGHQEGDTLKMNLLVIYQAFNIKLSFVFTILQGLN